MTLEGSPGGPTPPAAPATPGAGPAAPAAPAAPAPAPAPAPAAPVAPAAPAAPAQPGSGDGAWRAELPPELQQDPTLKSYKTLADAAKGLIEKQKLIGRSIRIPDDKATPQEIAAYRNKLGVPETPDGYQLEANPERPWDAESLTHFKTLFHETGVPAPMAQAIVKGYEGWAEQQKAAMLQQFAQGHEQLKKDWGKELYERRHGAAFGVIKKLAPPEVQTWLETTGYGDHPGLFTMFATIGEQFLEDGLIEGGGGGVSTEGAKDKIKAIREDKKHPFNNSMDPGHAQAKQQMEDLYKAAYGTAPAE